MINLTDDQTSIKTLIWSRLPLSRMRMRRTDILYFATNHRTDLSAWTGKRRKKVSKKERNLTRGVAKMFSKNIMFGKVIVRNEVPQVWKSTNFR